MDTLWQPYGKSVENLTLKRSIWVVKAYDAQHY